MGREGSPKQLSRAALRAALTPRRPEDHKGVFGHVLIAAGSRGMAGAAILSARGALRSGAGLVTVAVPAGVQAVVAGAVPAAMTLPLPEDERGAFRPDGVEALAAHARERRVTTLLIGPGLTTRPDAARFTLLALSALSLPAVVDADALNALSAQEPGDVARLLRGRAAPCVFTPHPGEMARALRTKTADVARDRAVCARRLAREWGGVALLKGKGTLISDGVRTVANPTGGPGLAKGGSGDVLGLSLIHIFTRVWKSF